MKHSLLFILIIGTAIADGADGNADAKVPPYQLKSHSDFNLAPDTRTPFWPIGWVKSSASPSAPNMPAPVDFQLEARYFSVTSVLLGSPALATINGRAFGEGEVLPVMRGSERLKVILRAIRDGGVTLDYNKQRLFVPLRQDLAPRPSDEKPAELKDFVIQILETKK